MFNNRMLFGFFIERVASSVKLQQTFLSYRNHFDFYPIVPIETWRNIFFKTLLYDKILL